MTRRKLKPFRVTGCPEDLDSMEIVAGGRHCTTCDKKVWDLTRVTEAEAAAVFQREGRGICVRVRTNSSGNAAFRPRKHTAFVLLSTLVASASGCQEKPMAGSIGPPPFRHVEGAEAEPECEPEDLDCQLAMPVEDPLVEDTPTSVTNEDEGELSEPADEPGHGHAQGRAVDLGEASAQ